MVDDQYNMASDERNLQARKVRMTSFLYMQLHFTAAEFLTEMGLF